MKVVSEVSEIQIGTDEYTKHQSHLKSIGISISSSKGNRALTYKEDDDNATGRIAIGDPKPYLNLIEDGKFFLPDSYGMYCVSIVEGEEELSAYLVSYNSGGFQILSKFN